MKSSFIVLMVLSLAASCTTTHKEHIVIKEHVVKKENLPTFFKKNKITSVLKTIQGRYETREFDEKNKLDLYHDRGFEIKKNKLINFPGSKKDIEIKAIMERDVSGTTKIYVVKDSDNSDYVLYLYAQVGRIAIVSPKTWGDFMKFNKGRRNPRLSFTLSEAA